MLNKAQAFMDFLGNNFLGLVLFVLIGGLLFENCVTHITVSCNSKKDNGVLTKVENKNLQCVCREALGNDSFVSKPECRWETLYID